MPEQERQELTTKLGRTFISDPDEEGEQVRAKILEAEGTGDHTADKKKELFKLKCRVGEKIFTQVMTYSKMLEWCDRDLDKDDMYKIEAILSHRKKDGKWQLKIQWGDATITWNDLDTTWQDDPVSVAMYAKKNDLLKTPGWKRCKHIAKNSKVLARMINQARLKNLRNRPVYKYGFQVPRNHEEAVAIDERMGNTMWQDAEKLEIQQLFDYEAFKSIGLKAPTPEGYQRIPCHMVYDVKHDGPTNVP